MVVVVVVVVGVANMVFSILKACAPSAVKCDSAIVVATEAWMLESG